MSSPNCAGVKSKRRTAFSLIEMIGVMAVVTILAAILIPKVFEAINNARINGTALSVNTIKTASIDHFARFNSFMMDASPPLPVPLTPAQQTAFDLVLVAESFLDKPFATKLGDGATGSSGTRIEVVNIGGKKFDLGDKVDGTDKTGFHLGGSGNGNQVFGSACVEAVITGVTALDAVAINDCIDGPSLGAQGNTDDTKGRVKYEAPKKSGLTDVYIYLTHR